MPVEIAFRATVSVFDFFVTPDGLYKTGVLDICGTSLRSTTT